MSWKMENVTLFAVPSIIISLSAQIFVAGRAKDMPDAVVSAIKEVSTVHGSHYDPDGFVKELEKAGRLQFETWD